MNMLSKVTWRLWKTQVLALAQELERAVAAGMETKMALERLRFEYGANLCGPYALALLLEDQGRHADLRDLADMAGSDGTGTSLAGLLAAATGTGLTAYADKVETITALRAPLIAHFVEDHFVFVSVITTEEVVFEDMSGEQVLSYDGFDRMFSGYALRQR